MSAFAEVRIDDDLIIYRTIGGPSFSTIVAPVQSGQEARNSLWANPLGKWELGERQMMPADFEIMQNFFNARKGKWEGFRFKDWSDFKDVGAGVLTQIAGPTFQMYKNYLSGGTTTARKITKPIATGLAFNRNGTPIIPGVAPGNYAIDITTGIATFAADSSSTVTAITVGATTQVTLTAALTGLIVGGTLYLSGLGGANAALLNGLSHTITAVAGNVYTLGTNTFGKTITAAGSGYKYPQPTDVLTWTGQYDRPVRFDTDEIRFEFIAAAGTGGAENVTDVYFHLYSLPIIELRL